MRYITAFKQNREIMNYKIILDEKVLEDFVRWLPDLQNGEAFYIVLLARNKYVRDLAGLTKIPHIASDKQQLARIVCNKASLHPRIKQLECELGAYRTRDGEPMPQEALALYITVNPRSHILASKEALKMLADYLTSAYNGYRLDQDVVSCIQRACGRKVFFDLDFDGADLKSTVEQVHQYINPSCVSVLKTRGGFHLLVELAKIDAEFKRSWYQKITALPGVDVRGDNLIPVPGCIQGMFTPHFV
jgi:hypothetical protein